MKEKDLIKIGFQRTDVSAEESGDKAYHYYTYELFQKYAGITLLSNSNDETKKDEWIVTFLEENRIQFRDKKDVKKLIELLSKNIIDKNTL